MKLSNWNKKYLKPILIITLLVALLGMVTACEEMGFPPPSQPEVKPPQEIGKTETVIRSKDDAILAVYQHLLNQAESQEAKIYLADFYAACDNWQAESEFFKDGSATWHIQVDMTGSLVWEWQSYWQQASWFVFKDSRVIPSNLFKANALRIEADLQELSPKPGPPPMWRMEAKELLQEESPEK